MRSAFVFFESMPDGVYIGTAQGITETNPAGAELLGFRHVEEAIDELPRLREAIQTRYADSGERVALADEPFVRALSGLVTVREIAYLEVSSRREVRVRCAASPIREGGIIVGAIAINTLLSRSTARPTTPPPRAHPAARPRRAGMFLTTAEVTALGVALEIGARFSSDMLDLFGGTYEVVSVSEQGAVVQRLDAVQHGSNR